MVGEFFSLPLFFSVCNYYILLMIMDNVCALTDICGILNMEN